MKSKCIDCGKVTKGYGKRCYSCQGKYRYIENKELIKISINNLPKNLGGKNSSNYKDGRTLKPNYCIDCRKQLSDYRIKRCKKCLYKYMKKAHKMSGESNPMFGKENKWGHHTKESKRKISEFHKGIKFTEDHKQKLSLAHGGTGISRENTEYGAEFDNSLKEQVRFRDGYKCQVCDCPQIENGRQLDVHHIDYDKKNNKINNLITLCRSCHTRTNANRKHWIEYLIRRQTRCSKK